MPFWMLVLLFVVLIGVGKYALSRVRDKEAEDPGFYFGELRPQLVCPHCHSNGCVYLRDAVVKDGISGAKAAGAIATGGISVLATGLSQKKNVTEALCGNCKVKWII